LIDDVGGDVLTRHFGERTATALLDDGMHAFDLAALLRMAEAMGIEVAVVTRQKAA
jgi:hypothetical protein